MAKFQISDLIGPVDNQKVIDDYLKWQDDVFDLILQQNPHLTSSIRNSGQIPLHLLTYPDRVAAMGKYRSITRMNEVFDLLSMRDSGIAPTPDLIKSLGGVNRAKQVTNIMHGLKTIRGFDTEAPFAKAPVSFAPGGNPLDALYARMNINFDLSPKDVRAGIPNASSAATAAHHFGPGVYNMPATSPSFFTTSNSIKPGSKFMTFDIETAGLMKNQIREVAYRTGVADAAGMLSGNGGSRQLLFGASQMGRGSIGFNDGIGGRVKSHTLDEFVSLKYNIDPDTVSSADNFAPRMRGFLENMRDSDHLIGHNIGAFDIPQLHSQLTSSALYRGDEGFRQLVDTAFDGAQNKVIDTLTLAQRAPNLAELNVAKELGDLGGGKVYSIENLLLETDLAEKIGIDKLKEIMKQVGGLHVGAVDDLVTQQLFQHVNDISIKKLEDPALRSAILRSSALTPITDLDMSNVTSRVKRILRSSEGTLHSGINPIEHQILETRNLRLGIHNQNITDPASMIFRTNMYDRMAYKGISGRRNPSNMILGQRSDITAREFRDFQRSMARKNMPFAGLSLEERRFGTSLAHMTSRLAPGAAAQTISPLASDFMVSHFKTFEAGSVNYLPKSLRPSMPIGFLKDSNLLERGTLLKMSVVERTAKSAEETVNLVFNFRNQDEVESFATRLTTLADNPNNLSVASILGYSDDVDQTDAAMLSDVSKFREAVRNGLPEQIRSTGLKTGISVGQLGVEESRGVIAGLKQFHSMDALRDTSMLDIGLPYADDITDEGGRGVVRTAGAILDRGLTDSDRVSFGVSVGKTQNGYEAMRQLATKSENKAALKAAQIANKMGPKAQGAVWAGYETAQMIRPHIPKLLGFAALGSIGMHFWNKKKENEPYNELFDPSQTTDTRYAVADLLQMKKDEGINLSHQRYDPLSTAYVTENLNNAKIGHTNMSWDRNSGLYGGIL